MSSDQDTIKGAPSEGIKSWVMVVLTCLFLALYASALTGWLRPVSDVTMITRLEPLIFVIIGYYFGRIPSQANEQRLADDIERESKRLEACHFAKEVAEKERDVIEEKARNARIVLTARSNKELDHPPAIDTLTAAISTAVEILDS